jgi:hypothetical protein
MRCYKEHRANWCALLFEHCCCCSACAYLDTPCHSSTIVVSVDFDFKTKLKLTDSDKQKYACTAQAAIKELIGTGCDEHKSIVCVVQGDDRMRDVEGATLFKDGVHQHWPRLSVDHKQAKHLLTNVCILQSVSYNHVRDVQ